MSTRATVIIKDECQTLLFYRHSDGYPSHCGVDLAAFCGHYTAGLMRLDAGQSSGWLILRGHAEYNENRPCVPLPGDTSMGWKCGAYEPINFIPADNAYIYTIDLVKRTLICKGPTKMKAVKF